MQRHGKSNSSLDVLRNRLIPSHDKLINRLYRPIHNYDELSRESQLIYPRIDSDGIRKISGSSNAISIGE